MSGLNDIVTITITSATAGVQQAGFGVPLILSHTAGWTERVRFYTDLDGVVSDFASTTSPEYLAAVALFGQEPRPPRIAIGRAALVPTQRFSLALSDVTLANVYSLRGGAAGNASYTAVAAAAWAALTAYTTGQAVTNDTGKVYVCITAGTSAGSGGPTGTTADITDGTVHWMYAAASGTVVNDVIVYNLMKAFNALSLALTCSLQGSVGSKTLRLLANAAGAFFDLENLTVAVMTLKQDHADPGVATDLAAIKLETNEWYELLTHFNSSAYVAAAAAWVQANKKIYSPTLMDTEIITIADGTATDIAHALKAAAYSRTFPIYHPASGAMAGQAWAGRVLPDNPGSETWKFKTLAGITVVQLTDTHLANLIAKKCNYYYAIAGVNITAEGKMSSGEYVDVVRFRDWLEARMAEAIFGALIRAEKIPYTDEGVAVIEAEVRGVLKEGVAVGGLSPNPKPTVTVPLVASVSSNDKAARLLRNVFFTGTLAGAIHSGDIRGTISV